MVTAAEAALALGLEASFGLNVCASQAVAEVGCAVGGRHQLDVPRQVALVLLVEPFDPRAVDALNGTPQQPKDQRLGQVAWH